MTDDVQLLVTTKLFAPCGLLSEWTYTRSFTDNFLCTDAHMRCALLIPPHRYSLVSSTFHAAFVHWKQSELLRASDALVTHAVNGALRMCSRYAYPAQGVPCSSFLDVSLCLKNDELLAVRCVRDGKLRKHCLKTTLRKAGRLSSCCAHPPQAAWAVGWEGHEADDEVEAWEHSQRVGLTDWLCTELKKPNNI